MKEKTKYTLIKHRHYFYKGMSEIVGIKGIVEFFILISIWVQLKGIVLPAWAYPLCGVAAVVGCWFTGWMWDKAHLYHTEAAFGNRRDPMLKETWERTIETEKRVNEIWEKLCKK